MSDGDLVGAGAVNQPKSIEQLPILPDVVTWIRDGVSNTIIANRIKQQGFFPYKSPETVRRMIWTFINRMAPADVAAHKQSGAILRAAQEVGGGLDRLRLMASEYKRHTAVANEYAAVVMEAASLVLRIRDQGYMAPAEAGEIDEAGDRVAAPRTGLELLKELRGVMDIQNEGVALPSEISAMSREDALLYLVLNGPAMKNLSKAMDTLNKSAMAANDMLVSQVEVMEKLGLLAQDSGEQTEAAAEAELSIYVKARFPGNVLAQEALLNPDRREKITSLYEKLLTRPRLIEALEVVSEQERKQAALEAAPPKVGPRERAPGERRTRKKRE